MDAWAVVEAAKNWTSVKPQAWYYSPWMHVRHDIPQGTEGLKSTFEVTADMLNGANLERLEHVTVTMNVDHTRRGDLSAELISPFGVTSHIATARRNDNAQAGYVDWTFMSVAHWSESGIGTWTVVLKDTNVNDHSGHWVDWRLRLWGECIDPSIQGLRPLPTEHDDDDHNDETTTAIVGTTTHGQTHPTGEPMGNPDDHHDRPVNAKPTTTTPAPTSLPTETTAPAVPGKVEGGTEDDKETPAKPENDSTFLPSPFPTFGVSKGTQVWIYGTAALIAIFCTSLTVWYVYTRRRWSRNARDEYEFEMLNENDADDDGTRARNGGANGNSNSKQGKRRAGELYDAFAEGSEDDVFSLGDEEEEHERYRDDEGERRDTEKRDERP